MVKVVGIRFKPVGKIYYFNPGDCKLSVVDGAVVETSRGVEYGEVVLVDKEVDEESFNMPIKSILRKATHEDKEQVKENKKRTKEAFDICLEKIKENKLEMNLVDVEYTFDKSKILFYFTADGRVDFRQLVKDLASVFRTRIELRQIGVRDEAKLLGGLGICGRPLCCSRFLGDFEPVSIKMAKEQSLSLNPTKISGTCGRLMCCLKYEQDAYEDLLERTPNDGAVVDTPMGKGTVVSSHLLRGIVQVKLDSDNETVVNEFKVDDIVIIKNTSRARKEDGEAVDINTLKELEKD
ncbi:MAG: stage 0 sporulation family protein [Clostridia bacterium]|nr:stage 0 sporulation family protein [Clostridia bacterium]